MTLRRYTFKKFMLIPKSTDTELVEEMIGIDMAELSQLTTQNAARKWYERLHKTEAPELLGGARRTENKDYLKGIPNDWCSILKQQCSLCEICKDSVRNAAHMEEKHKIEIYPYKEIWELIKEFHDSVTEKQDRKNTIFKVKRQVFTEKWTEILRLTKDKIEREFNNIYSKITRDLPFRQNKERKKVEKK